MIICRALLAVGIVVGTIPYAGAQFGGMPGMPGGWPARRRDSAVRRKARRRSARRC